jgi:hypothetical protein
VALSTDKLRISTDRHLELSALQQALSQIRFAAFIADDAEAIDRVRQIIRELDQRTDGGPA